MFAMRCVQLLWSIISKPPMILWERLTRVIFPPPSMLVSSLLPPQILGWTALMNAAWKGHWRVVDHLIKEDNSADHINMKVRTYLGGAKTHTYTHTQTYIALHRILNHACTFSSYVSFRTPPICNST
jgi:hypothetical protein